MHRSVHVVFVATECVPFIKVGGLADVVGSLPRALEMHGAHVEVVIPFEPAVPGQLPAEPPDPFPVIVGGETIPAAVHRSTLPNSNVRVSMIEGGGFFPRGGIYTDPETGRDYADQLERWVFFQKAALALIARDLPEVDVIHCHEHQTSLIPSYLGEDPDLRGTPSVLTIHNLGYQGIFSLGRRTELQLPESLSYPGGPLEFYGQLNFMKCGILTASAVTVVSPTYAREIQTPEFGYGLDGVVAQRSSDLFGILNGIDTLEWDPHHDSRIRARYSRQEREGKQADRRDLLSSFGLPPESGVPVLAMVSRIDAHKGFDLLLPILDEILRRGARFVLLGTGDPEIIRSLEDIASVHPRHAAIRIAFDDTLAHQVIAGADIFLMPSRYEPCGLTQMYALRYGAVPVVRSTGGLSDTVEEFDAATNTGNGFTFSQYDATEFRKAVNRAIDSWNGPAWSTIVENGMACDFSWNAAVPRYQQVYEHVMNGRKGPLDRLDGGGGE